MKYPKFTIILLSGRCAGILVLRWYFSLTSQAVVVYLPNEYTRFTMKMQMEERSVWLSALAPNKRELCIPNMADREEQTNSRKQWYLRTQSCQFHCHVAVFVCICISLFLSLPFEILSTPSWLHSLILHHLFFASFNPKHCKMLKLSPSASLLMLLFIPCAYRQLMRMLENWGCKNKVGADIPQDWFAGGNSSAASMGSRDRGIDPYSVSRVGVTSQGRAQAVPGASEHHSPLAQLIQGAPLYRKTSGRGQPLQDKEGGSGYEFVVQWEDWDMHIYIYSHTNTHEKGKIRKIMTVFILYETSQSGFKLFWLTQPWLRFFNIFS